ncbi:hypothetical protein NTGHW29_510042 [Candidatus Nitrotoga sp. HW29]|nr:hypothetical protein NTGHW29_510042 [Candidatus Nitrotoga sp. HW29]
MGLTDITEEQVQRAVKRLNHQPRKVLGFKPPHEILFGVEMRVIRALGSVTRIWSCP